MLGYNTMSEVGIWVQVEQSSSVTLSIWEETQPNNKQSVAPSFISDHVPHIVRFRPGSLKPGTMYHYSLEGVETDKVYAFTTQELWQHRTDPPAFKVAMGSCAYINEEAYDRPGKPYGGGYGIFETIAEQSPNVMLWLGDNIYLREYDWSSRSGYVHRYNHTRSLPEMQRLLETAHNYAIWDDHDFGPNDAVGSWIHKDWALEYFNQYWMNSPIETDDHDGITNQFSYNDIDFFLLDNRWNRTSHDNKEQNPQILGYEQIEWLIEALKFSKSPFKMVAVGGQVLNTAAVYENHARYEDERAYLLKRIVEEGIKGVVFVNGDRHHTELSSYESNGITIYDLTVSPLTSGVHGSTDEPNELRVENTFVAKRNFAVLEFNGKSFARELNISIFDEQGSVIWHKSLPSQTSR